MVLGVSLQRIEQAWDSCLDIVAFTGVGYLCGRAVNWYIKWTSKPSLFGKAETIDLKSAAICCSLFIAIDHIALLVLRSYLGKDSKYIDKTGYKAIRIGLDLTAAIGIFRVLAPRLNLVNIEFEAASAVILMAVVAYSQMIFHLEVFNAHA